MRPVRRDRRGPDPDRMCGTRIAGRNVADRDGRGRLNGALRDTSLDEALDIDRHLAPPAQPRSGMNGLGLERLIALDHEEPLPRLAARDRHREVEVVDDLLAVELERSARRNDEVERTRDRSGLGSLGGRLSARLARMVASDMPVLSRLTAVAYSPSTALPRHSSCRN